jgi:hypothetical protein
LLFYILIRTKTSTSALDLAKCDLAEYLASSFFLEGDSDAA